jgi:AMP deaminase
MTSLLLPDCDQYHRIRVTSTPSLGYNADERKEAAETFRECMQLRDSYLYAPKVPEHLDENLQSFQDLVRSNPLSPPKPMDEPDDVSALSVTFGDDGIGIISGGAKGDNYNPPFTLTEFNRDVSKIWSTATGKVTNSFAFRRLKMLDVNYEFHTLMNETHELHGTKDDKADFNKVTKVDVHLHAASAFTREELLVFIQTKMIEDKDKVVLNDGMTLDEVLKTCDINDVDEITTDRLDVAANASMFHRFDNFNDSYNPFGAKDLRTIFMKTSNHLNGLYFGELIRDVVINRVQKQKNRVAIEPRLSIYGRGGFKEWEALSSWVLDHQVLDIDSKTGHTTGHVKWMIQIPR